MNFTFLKIFGFDFSRSLQRTWILFSLEVQTHMQCSHMAHLSWVYFTTRIGERVIKLWLMWGRSLWNNCFLHLPAQELSSSVTITIEMTSSKMQCFTELSWTVDVTSLRGKKSDKILGWKSAGGCQQQSYYLWLLEAEEHYRNCVLALSCCFVQSH